MSKVASGKKWRLGFAAMLLSLVMAIAVACASGENPTEGSPSTDQAGGSAPRQAQPDSTPVELTVLSTTNMAQEEIDTRLVGPMKSKHPNITLNVLNNQGSKLEELVAAGQTPDVILAASAMYMSRYGDLGLFFDMNPLIKKYQFDLNRLEPIVLKAIKSYSKNDELYALPYSTIGFALYYNKDIFDKFGVPYPKDGMTWEETLTLARSLTRKADNIQYRGLAFQDVNGVASPLSLNYVDPKTGKSTVNTDGWKEAFELVHSIISIPGNEPVDKSKRFDNNPFMADRNVAMFATVNLLANGFGKASEAGLNWDLVTYPTYKERPGMWGQPDGQAVLITPSSKHKDQAFQLVESILSDEAQANMAKIGIMPAVTSPKVREVFGTSLSYSLNKNVGAFFKNKPAPWRSNITKYDQNASQIMFTHYLDLYSGKDTNTILREAEEDVNAYIAKNP
jgi:multiple sugar transport system substrate-binding protein